MAAQTKERILYMQANHVRGVIHGRTIELVSDPGLADGAEVEVTLVPATTLPSGDGWSRAAGALADEWTAEDDAILESIQQERLRSINRPLPS
jgi:hypothetical protein